jgi:acyl-CoA reductase-like NAD-dependent aldehyde dehydrogenase
MATLASINPANNEVLGEIQVSTENEIQQALQRAHKAKEQWKEVGVTKRIELLTKVYEVLLSQKDKIARLDSQEMGFPITQCLEFNLGDAFNYFKWNLDNAEKYLSPKVTYEDNASIHTVYHEPRGVVAVIQPWNFPFCQWSWSVVANLLAGNVVIYKPSEEVPLSSKYLEQAIYECNLPDGILQFVYGGEEIGEYLVNQEIDMIVFTGSVKTGKKLYQQAARKFIPALLELGGSAPGIVFEDTDIDAAVETIFWQRFANCGQTCDGLKRLIVQEKIVNEIVNKLKVKLDGAAIGEPSKDETIFGPLAAEKQIALLEDQVKDALTKGATVVTGGDRPTNLIGNYYKPTLLTNINDNMRVWTEEVFGPVLPIRVFNTEEEAINLANNTNYGLGAYLYTRDKVRAKRVAGKLESGMVSINGSNYVLPMNPFGGYKQSGMGREHGKYGFTDVTQIKVVAEEK